MKDIVFGKKFKQFVEFITIFSAEKCFFTVRNKATVIFDTRVTNITGCFTYNTFKNGKSFSEKTYSVSTRNSRQISITRGRKLVLIRNLQTAWAFTSLLNKLLIGLGAVTGITDLLDVVLTSLQVKKSI